MKYFISPQNVIESIDYFKEAGFNKDDNLFLYLMAKHYGISNSSPVTFKVGNLTEEQKNDYLNTIWMLSGLYDPTETGEKNSLMFPTGFGTVAQYQPGTESYKVLGRIKDTIEKKNINIPIYDDNDSSLKLKLNYQDLISDNYLNSEKISLRHLATWVFRFTSFEFESDPTEFEFTKVIHRAIVKYFKVSKRDYSWLFEDDLYSNYIQPAENRISGSDLRDNFEFKKSPDIVDKNDIASPSYQESEFSKQDVEKYLSISGDNPSDSDILQILLSKKQIVITGVPGVGKSRYTQMLIQNDDFKEFELVQFHANYSYEDFIGGETLRVKNGATTVDIQKGVFLRFLEKVKKQNESDNNKKYLFIIDELNRGNIAEIFGETILTLDRGYKVKLSKQLTDDGFFEIPDNVYIVGTMNTSDRNIAFLDLAIRRRFAFVSLLPNYEFLSEKVKIIGEESIDLGSVLRKINQRILYSLKDNELLLGQSYFIPFSEDEKKYEWSIEEFKNQFNFVLLPTLREYSFNDESLVSSIIGEQLADSLQDLDDFKTAFKNEFVE